MPFNIAIRKAVVHETHEIVSQNLALDCNKRLRFGHYNQFSFYFVLLVDTNAVYRIIETPSD